MSIFHERGKTQEKKFSVDQTHEFKVSMTRNQLIGLWMATKIGLQGHDADSYVEEVVKSDFEKPGPDDVVEKLMRDVKKYDLNISEAQIRRKMTFFHDRAEEQLASK